MSLLTYPLRIRPLPSYVDCSLDSVNMIRLFEMMLMEVTMVTAAVVIAVSCKFTEDVFEPSATHHHIHTVLLSLFSSLPRISLSKSI